MKRDASTQNNPTSFLSHESAQPKATIKKPQRGALNTAPGQLICHCCKTRTDSIMNTNSNQKVQSFDDFLTHINSVKEKGSRVMGCCPAHDDTNPSLSIKQEGDKILLHCHAGCQTEEILEAIGLEMTDLFIEEEDTSWDPWEGTKVAIYTYTDADGNPLFQVVRYEMRDPAHPACGEKKFLQRRYAPNHPDAGKKGCPDGYVWGLEDIQRVLFNLPEVLSAIEEDKIVWFVEGEKDVRNLQEEGLVATCNPGGAAKGDDPGRKFTSEMAEFLEGADVVIIPDHDEPGRQFAESVAERIRPKVDRVRVPQLTDVRKGGDVTDFLENGHSVEELRELVSETDPFEPPPDTVDEVVDRAFEEEDPSVVFGNIDVLARADDTDFYAAREKLKEATGVNLNQLDKAVRKKSEELEQEQKREARQAGFEKQDVPKIVVTRGVSADIVDKLSAAVEDKNDPPKVFRRGGQTVRVKVDARGRTQIVDVSEAYFDDLVTRSAYCVDHKNRPRDPIKRLVRRVQEHVDLPFLSGLTKIPILRSDGSIFTEPGYDEETCQLYRPGPDVEAIKVPEEPTPADISEAVDWLEEAWWDHPFVGKASWTNMIALALTPVVRPLLGDANVPLGIISAPRKGSGKDLAAKIAALASTGRYPGTMSNLSRSEEWRKQITAQLKEGERFVLIGDVDGPLDNAPLRRVLTTPVWSDRVLNFSQQVRLPANALWCATGNNLRPTGDMIRRCFLIRLDTEMQRPHVRTDFKYEQPEWAQEHRGELSAALLTLARAWIIDGMPTSDTPTLGSFEKWCRVVGGILKHAGFEDFLGNQDELSGTEFSEENHWSMLLEAIYRWQKETRDGEPFTASELAERIETYEKSTLESDESLIGPIVDHLPERIQSEIRNGEPFTRSLGRTFGGRKNQIFSGGWVLVDEGKDRAGTHWTVAKESAE